MQRRPAAERSTGQQQWMDIADRSRQMSRALRNTDWNRTGEPINKHTETSTVQFCTTVFIVQLRLISINKTQKKKTLSKNGAKLDHRAAMNGPVVVHEHAGQTLLGVKL